MRMKIARFSNTRPDMQFEISQLAQIKQLRFDSDAAAHIKRINQLVRYTKQNSSVIKIPELDRGSVRIVGYSDAAYFNNHDNSSQLGRIILLVDETNSAIPIAFKSYKSRRVTRSVLSEDVFDSVHPEHTLRS